MKKSLIHALWSIMLVTFCAGCSSSSNSNDEGDGNQPKPKETATVTYYIQTLYDLTLFFDVEATYTDLAGETHKKSVTSLPWSAEIKGDATGAKVNLKLSFTLKEGIESTKSLYKFGSDMGIKYLSSENKFRDNSDTGSIEVSAAKLDNAIEIYLERGMEISLNTDI